MSPGYSKLLSYTRETALRTQSAPRRVYIVVTTLVTMSRSQHVKDWRKATKQRMVAAMGGKCQCCGYDRCVESLDFHHINPENKEMNLGAVRANPKAWEHIANELRKCILICRNCHGEIHYQGRSLPDNYTRFDERYAEYKSHHKSHPELTDKCPHCSGPKPTYQFYCSRSCAASSRISHPIDWSQYDLSQLATEMTTRQIAEHVGVSGSAVTYHLRKQGLSSLQPSSKARRTGTPYIKKPKVAKPKPPRVSDLDPNWRHRPNPKNRKVERPPKEELETMVWESSLLAVSKRYGVRDNTIRKWCKNYDIKPPPQGYAQRRQAGYSHEESLISQKRPLKGKRFITLEVAQQAAALRAQNLSYREIGDELGFGHWSIQSALRRYGLEDGCSAPARTGDSKVTASHDAASPLSNEKNRR